MNSNIADLPSLSSFNTIERNEIINCFLLVANEQNWKKPVNKFIVCDWESIEKIIESIKTVTGSKDIEVVHEVNGYRITAEGYYNAVDRGRGLII